MNQKFIKTKPFNYRKFEDIDPGYIEIHILFDSAKNWRSFA